MAKKKKNTIQDKGVVEETTTEIEDVHVETETEEAEETETTSPHVRDSVIDEIAAKRRDRRDNGIEDDVEDIDNHDIVLASNAPDESLDQEDEDPMVSLKVDGEVVEKLQSEVDAAGGIAQIQKKLSGEKRLKAASIKKKDQDARELEQTTREQNLIKREKEVDRRIEALENRQVVDVDETPIENLDQLTDDVLGNIYKGNEAEAKEALKTLIGSLRKTTVVQGQPSLSEDAILEKAMFEIDRRDGQKLFLQDYAHLAEDDNLFEMTNAETIKVENEHPDWNPKDIILEAAKRTEAWRLEVLGEDPDKDTEEETELEERTEAKRNTNPIPTAKTRVKAREGFKPRTQAEIFEEIKATRVH